MEWSKVLELILVFWSDGRVKTILGLILLDVVLAVAAAIKAGEFDWRRLGEFYRTMVVPYILGYLAFYGAGFLLDPQWLGGAGYIISEAMMWAPWAALIANLVADVLRSVNALGYTVPPDEPPV